MKVCFEPLPILVGSWAWFEWVVFPVVGANEQTLKQAEEYIGPFVESAIWLLSMAAGRKAQPAWSSTNVMDLTNQSL